MSENFLEEDSLPAVVDLTLDNETNEMETVAFEAPKIKTEVVLEENKFNGQIFEDGDSRAAGDLLLTSSETGITSAQSCNNIHSLFDNQSESKLSANGGEEAKRNEPPVEVQMKQPAEKTVDESQFDLDLRLSADSVENFTSYSTTREQVIDLNTPMDALLAMIDLNTNVQDSHESASIPDAQPVESVVRTIPESAKKSGKKPNSEISIKPLSAMKKPVGRPCTVLKKIADSLQEPDLIQEHFLVRNGRGSVEDEPTKPKKIGYKEGRLSPPNFSKYLADKKQRSLKMNENTSVKLSVRRMSVVETVQRTREVVYHDYLDENNNVLSTSVIKDSSNELTLSKREETIREACPREVDNGKIEEKRSATSVEVISLNDENNFANNSDSENSVFARDSEMAHSIDSEPKKTKKKFRSDKKIKEQKEKEAKSPKRAIAGPSASGYKKKPKQRKTSMFADVESFNDLFRVIDEQEEEYSKQNDEESPKRSQIGPGGHKRKSKQRKSSTMGDVESFNDLYGLSDSKDEASKQNGEDEVHKHIDEEISKPSKIGPKHKRKPRERKASMVGDVESFNDLYSINDDKEEAPKQNNEKETPKQNDKEASIEENTRAGSPILCDSESTVKTLDNTDTNKNILNILHSTLPACTVRLNRLLFDKFPVRISTLEKEKTLYGNIHAEKRKERSASVITISDDNESEKAKKQRFSMERNEKKKLAIEAEFDKIQPFDKVFAKWRDSQYYPALILKVVKATGIVQIKYYMDSEQNLLKRHEFITLKDIKEGDELLRQNEDDKNIYDRVSFNYLIDDTALHVKHVRDNRGEIVEFEKIAIPSKTAFRILKKTQPEITVELFMKDFTDFEFYFTKNGTKRLVYKSREFKLTHTSKKTSIEHWKCISYPKCKATLKILDGDFYPGTTHHSCNKKEETN